MIFDTHCHLNSEELYPNINEVIKRAEEAGVERFLVVGWNKQSSLLAIKIANQYNNVYAAIGFHPCDIFDVSDEDYFEVMKHIDDPKVVAVGEIGLDYHWIKEQEKRDMQKAWFIRQIKFANEHNKPISVHNRDAFEDCIKILKEYRPTNSGVMHCYSGSVESLRDVLNIGMVISFGGPLTFTNAKTPKEVCSVVPLNKVLVETDCPYLAPHPLRGTINEPKNIKLVVEEMARIKGISVDELEKILFDNANKLFHV